MSTSLHPVINVVFGNVVFVIVFFKIRGRKMRFSASSQNSIYKNTIFGQLEAIFLNV